MQITIHRVMAEYGRIWAIAEEEIEWFAGLPYDRPPEAKVPAVPKVQGTVAIIPVRGIISQRADGFLDAFYGGTSTDRLGQAIDSLVADESIGGIVLDIASPGGTVFGVPEVAGKIRAAREVKPIVALADSYAQSAAYWIGSQASQMFVTPSGKVGSIGVYLMHVDASKVVEQEGYKVEFIKAGRYKVEGNEFEPLGDDTREFLQADVDRYYGMFVKDVAAGRRVSTKKVLSDFGEGRSYGAEDAVAAGMVDGVATLEEIVARMAGRPKGRVKAEEDKPEPAAEDKRLADRLQKARLRGARK